MERQYKNAMDTVKMTQRARERIETAIEGRCASEVRGRGSQLVLLMAAVLILLMGAAYIWQVELLEYFEKPMGEVSEGMSQYVQPVQASGSSENGWTLTVDECVGDDEWVFLWMTLTAPEGTKLPVLGEGEEFYLRSVVVSAGDENNWGGYGVRDILYDGVSGDNQLKIALGMGPEIDPRGQKIRLTAGPLDRRGGTLEGREIVWDGELVVEDIVLDYPNTVSLTPLTQRALIRGTEVEAVCLKVTPFYFTVEFQSEQLASQIVGLPETVATSDMPVEIQFENGTVIRPAVFSDGPVPDDPYRFYIEWGYQYTNGVIDGQVDTNKTFMVDPTRIKSFRLNGVEIPFRYDPA